MSCGSISWDFLDLGIEKEKAHACDLCNKRFAVPCLLRDHKDSVHNGIKKSHFGSNKSVKKENIIQEPMECKSCSITFKFPSIYIKHYQDTHGTLPPEYVDKENFNVIRDHNQRIQFQ